MCSCDYNCEIYDNDWDCPEDCPVLKHNKELEDLVLGYMEDGFTLDEALEILRELQHV